MPTPATPGYQIPGGGYGAPYGYNQGPIPAIRQDLNATAIENELAMQPMTAQELLLFNSPAYQHAVRSGVLPDPKTPQGRKFPFPCPEKIGDPYKVCISNREGNPANIGTIAAGAGTVDLRERVGVDFLCLGAYALAIDSAGPPGNYTMEFGWNAFNDLSGGQWLYRTIGNQALGSMVPAVLTLGSAGFPYRWPAPHIFRSTDVITTRILPNPVGANLDYIKIVFWGRQLKGLEASDLLQFNPEVYGYSGVVLDPALVTFSGANGVPGAEVNVSGAISSSPYDMMISDESCMCFDLGAAGTQQFVVAPGMTGEIKIIRSAPRLELMNQFVPTSFYSGTLDPADALQAQATRSLASSSGSCWRIYQQSSLQMIARGLRTDATGRATTQVRYVAHGQRMPAQDNLPPFTGQEYTIQPIR